MMHDSATDQSSTSPGKAFTHWSPSQAVRAILFVLTEAQIRVMQKYDDVVSKAPRRRRLTEYRTRPEMVHPSDVDVR